MNSSRLLSMSLAVAIGAMVLVSPKGGDAEVAGAEMMNRAAAYAMAVAS